MLGKLSSTLQRCISATSCRSGKAISLTNMPDVPKIIQRSDKLKEKNAGSEVLLISFTFRREVSNHSHVLNLEDRSHIYCMSPTMKHFYLMGAVCPGTATLPSIGHEGSLNSLRRMKSNVNVNHLFIWEISKQRMR